MDMQATIQSQRKTKLLSIALVVGAVLALIIIVGFASLFVYIPYNQKVNGPKADATLKDLEREFHLVTPLPGAVQLEFESSHKINLGSVGAQYRTNKGYPEIRAYYESELSKNGWRFVKERPVTIWWRDYGGKEAFYCKGVFTANLQYAGQEPGVEWTYDFGMSWGLFDECR